VAPNSREYQNYRQRVGKEAQGNTDLEIEYEKIMNRVRQTRESVIRMKDRHFTAPVDEISGTVDEVSPHGITLSEYPGLRFQFSSVGMSAADMSARVLGVHNDMTRGEVAQEVDRRRGAVQKYQVSPSCPPQNISRAPEAGLRSRRPPRFTPPEWQKLLSIYVCTKSAAFASEVASGFLHAKPCVPRGISTGVTP
jgi:hypothetical protein